MPSRCNTAACAARHDQIVERVLVSAQSMTSVRSFQNGSSGSVAAFGSAPVTISPSICRRPRSAMSVYCLSIRDFASCDRLTDGSEKQWKWMRLLPAAALSRPMNWRSVACSAASGMLLMSPIVSTASEFRCLSSGSASCHSVGARPGLTMSRCLSNRRVMPGLIDLFRGLKPLMLRAGQRERLVDILDNVGGVFDADRKPDGFRQNAGQALLLGGHLAMRGRSGMAGEGFCIADIDQPRDQLQRVIEGLAGLKPALDAECEQGRSVAIKVFLHQRVIGAVGKAGIIDPRDARIAAQEVRDLARVLDMPFDA